MGERIAIIGSRAWTDFEMIRDFVYSLDADAVIISGGARGTDRTAAFYAEERGLCTRIFNADWDQHGKRAGLIRNHDIVNDADRVVAFWDGVSPGTKYTIDLAKAAGKPTLVFRSYDYNSVSDT